MTFAPAAPSFTLPRRRSHFPRIPFGGAHEDFGLPQQQLSTMGYPRKSYPHRCSPPCAKRSRPRACARVYIIYRSPVGRSRGVSAPLWGRGRAVVATWPAPACAGWGRARAKADAPSRSAPHFPCLRPSPCPSTAESLCAKAECTRQSPPLPVRSPRVSPPMAVHFARLWAKCRAQGGEGEGKGGRPLAQQPALSPPTAESLCAKAEVYKVIPAPARAFFPRQPAYGRAPAAYGRITVRKGGVHKVIPALPVRSPRVSPPTAAPPPADGRSAVRSPRGCLPTAAPLPAYGRSAERRVGKGEGKGGRPLAQQPALSPPTVEPLSAYRPAPVCLPPRHRRLNGSPASAGGRENDRMAHRRTAPPTHRTPRGNDTCTIRVPRRKGAQSVVHNL